METTKVLPSNLLYQEVHRLTAIIEDYNRIIAQTAIAWERIQSMQGCLNFDFKGSRYDDSSLSLFVYWNQVDRTALADIVANYAKSLLVRRIELEAERSGILQQLTALGEEPGIER